MNKKNLILLSVFWFTLLSFGQNIIDVTGVVNPDEKSITITQNINYRNTSKDTLTSIYLHDWNNAYATKDTPLAKRFEEEFSTKFHLAKKKQRGYTNVSEISNREQVLSYERLKNQIDIIKVNLIKPLLPNSYYNLTLKYNIVLPDATFTDFGYDDDKNFDLKYWYLLPVIYDGKWHHYSNKNLDDMYIPKSDIAIELKFPSNYNLISELNEIEKSEENGFKTIKLKGENRIDSYLSLQQTSDYKKVKTEHFTLISNIKEKGVEQTSKDSITKKITKFLTDNLGSYPHEKLLVTQLEYNKNPLYGLNQLPSFLRPFKSNFQYEFKLLKTALRKYLENIHLTNPRKSHWLNDGLSIYFLMKYAEDFYPDSKFLGTLAKYWGVRAFHIADLDYNAQYYLYSMEIARNNNDQALTTSKDSLIKFNANIAGKYKAGIGLNYLDKYASDINLRQLTKSYLNSSKLKKITPEDFSKFIKPKTTKNIDWFFEDYINTRKKIDFKLTDIKTEEDSIEITIKNLRNNNMPISLFSLKKNTVVNKIWLDSISGEKTIKIPNYDTDRIILDHENIIPEFNQRNNFKSTSGSSLWSKPLQFRLFKDIEDPYYNQVFFIPEAQFDNIYDGLTLGVKVYNKTILRKRLNYKFSPQYATRSKSLRGSGSVFYRNNIEDKSLFQVTYGIDASYESFAQDAFFRRIRPNISFAFRPKDDFRSNKRQFINLRYIDIVREIGPDAILENITEEPDYSVLNLRYVNQNIGIIDYSRFFADFQVAQNFSKISFNYEFRKLSKNNRNFNLRLFAGAFLKNSTDINSNFFSFALDRPTDYLFDFNYLGRSEDSGIFSQQIIIAEGGFKSQLDTPFANQWLTTANLTTSIWRYIQAYGDVGLVKNKFSDPKFVYDSGIRLNLVEDYFEIFFPIYSNNGWEIGQNNYDQKIRFKFTVDPQVLLGLFKRKWY